MPNRALPLPGPGPHRCGAGQLDRDAIVRAGIEIADAEGLGAVSIRRVAARLRARPMSLYTYIASKEDLLALMADRIVEEVLLPSIPEGWRAALRAIARRSHATFTAHPWVLEVAGRRPHLGPGAVRHAEQLLAAIEPLRAPPEATWTILYTVNDFTLGHALRVAQAAKEPGLGYPEFDPKRFPRLAAALPEAPGERGEGTFEAGLETVLDGIARRFTW